MPTLRRVEIRTYRSHRLEVYDDGRTGWRIHIHALPRRAEVHRLEDPAPGGLPALIARAQRRVDCLLDGAARS